MLNAKLSVGDVAKRCGVSVPTLHFYEAKGLLKSWRNAGNQRRYQKDVLRRVAVIKAAQGVGLSLNEIRSAFETLPEKRTPNKRDWEKLSREWKHTLNMRIVKLEKLRDKLSSCIGCGCLSLKACPLYNPEDKLAQQGVGGVLLNKN